MHLPVARRTTPEKLLHWENINLCIGLGVVESGPLIHSNSHADERSQKLSDLRS
jgi:lipoate synthase